jgi:hypothetical protein
MASLKSCLRLRVKPELPEILPPPQGETGTAYFSSGNSFTLPILSQVAGIPSSAQNAMSRGRPARQVW